MSVIKWDPSLSVNIKEIDNQHKKLVQILNQLADAMKMGKSKIVLNKILKELANYTVYHFKTEEELFKKYNYPMKSSHTKIHNDFVKKINNFIQDYKNGKSTLSIELLNFLVDWVKTHIKKTDKLYSKFLNDKGVF